MSEALTRDWRHEAACLNSGVHADVFFPLPSAEPESPTVQAAIAFCRRCPVRQDCLDESYAVGADAGIWGGLTEAERRSLKRRQRRAAKLGRQGAVA